MDAVEFGHKAGGAGQHADRVALVAHRRVALPQPEGVGDGPGELILAVLEDAVAGHEDIIEPDE